MFIPKRSRWKRKNGATVEVCSIWAKGGGDHYTPVSYEVKENGELREITREEMVRLIELKELNRV